MPGSSSRLGAIVASVILLLGLAGVFWMTRAKNTAPEGTGISRVLTTEATEAPKTAPAAGPGAVAQTVSQITLPFADFERRVNEFITLHKKLEAEVGPIDETKSPQEITNREIALGKRIAAARSQSQRGEFFTQEIEAAFRLVIREEYQRHAAPVRRDRQEDQDELADFQPAVNMSYPPTQPLVTFPAGLLGVLPRLPEQVEYRLVQKILILRDIGGNLILDYMPAATP